MIPAFEKFKYLDLQQMALQLICAVLLGLILWNCISAVTLFSGLSNVLKHSERGARNALAVQKTEHVASTLNYKFFGDYVPQTLDAAGVRQSMLNLTVVGVVFAVNEHDSQVMLRQANGQEHFFHIGDELPGGGVIKRITEEGVLIARDGELERLSLPKQTLKFEAPIKPIHED